MDSSPTLEDIESIFHRLRAIAANKICFDCNAKNPTWASVTYGVFICLDCSAVHRSLGVHLTFVRSTQLDTNWTWIQLRQMQLGGNSNAMQFFTQHNCSTTDTQKKYNSRAALLYREKLHQLALNSLASDNKLHINSPNEEKVQGKEIDFFSEHENNVSSNLLSESHIVEKDISKSKENGKLNNPGEGPTVILSLEGSNAEPHQSTITARKKPAKKAGFGTKKSGLGATKVKTNFADLEREAELSESLHLKSVEESNKAAALSMKEREEQEASVRLAYIDVSNEQKKNEQLLIKQDPKKAEQLERLGMGIDSKRGMSHSAVSAMQAIEQDNIQSTPSTLSSLGKLRISDNDAFFEDYSQGNSFSIGRISTGSYGSNKMESFFSETKSNTNKDWVIIDDPPEKPKKSVTSYDSKPRIKSSHTFDEKSSSDEAQKKFGNAKAISSDQFFNDQGTNYETKANLSRFQGSSSISSAEFFGNDNVNQNSGAGPSYDIEDVKESVKQGVTKVAGKLGSLASGLMSSIQDRYGY